MKKIDVERKLAEFGWYFCRHGGNHDVWTNGVKHEAIPRHREINEYTAKKILKTARENPAPKK